MQSILRDKATKLREQGFSYSEILKEIPVAKSTLSLWLRSVGLSNRQKQRLTQKKLNSARLGGQRKKEQRIKRVQEIKRTAQLETKKLSEDILWVMGVMLYWAEGSKDKDYKPGHPVSFSNSDSLMIKVFLNFLKSSLKVPDSKIITDIYIHENNKYRLDEVRKYWVQVTGFSISKFSKIYFKKHRFGSIRKRVRCNYYGQLRVRVRESSTLNRRISGWIEGLCLQCGMV